MSTEPRTVGVLITDFDGTITYHDFYQIVTQSMLPADGIQPFREYQRGAITHFEALRRIFAQVNVSEARFLEGLRASLPEPELADWVRRLRQIGWDVVITSAGCAWYIDRVLEEAGVRIERHANLGRFVDYGGLHMELPYESPYFSPQYGIDKAAAVRAAQERGLTVAYAGDGNSDIPAAELVPAELRFARSDLAANLSSRGIPYRPFERWREVAAGICEIAGR